MPSVVEVVIVFLDNVHELLYSRVQTQQSLEVLKEIPLRNQVKQVPPINS